MIGRCLVLAALLLAAAQPAQGQGQLPSTGAAKDFWVGMGRFIPADAGAGKKAEAPDLSGSYQVEGKSPGDSGSTYTSTLEVKRWKSIKSPQGGPLNTYRMKWTWDGGGVSGIGLLVGHRLYIAYGSENLNLCVGAPLALTDAENEAYAKYFKLYSKLRGTQVIKNPPWFYRLSLGYSSDGYKPAYYFYWISTTSSWGQQVMSEMPTWTDGSHYAAGGYLEDNGEFAEYHMTHAVHGYSVTWRVAAQGQNWSVVEHDDLSKHGDITGGGMDLDDGMVVVMTGGNDDCGYGYYEVKGKVLTGIYAQVTREHRGTETITPSAEIVAKNAALFGQ